MPHLRVSACHTLLFPHYKPYTKVRVTPNTPTSTIITSNHTFFLLIFFSFTLLNPIPAPQPPALNLADIFLTLLFTLFRGGLTLPPLTLDPISDPAPPHPNGEVGTTCQFQWALDMCPTSGRFERPINPACLPYNHLCHSLIHTSHLPTLLFKI